MKIHTVFKPHQLIENISEDQIQLYGAMMSWRQMIYVFPNFLTLSVVKGLSSFSPDRLEFMYTGHLDEVPLKFDLPSFSKKLVPEFVSESLMDYLAGNGDPFFLDRNTTLEQYLSCVHDLCEVPNGLNNVNNVNDIDETSFENPEKTSQPVNQITQNAQSIKTPQGALLCAMAAISKDQKITNTRALEAALQMLSGSIEGNYNDESMHSPKSHASYTLLYYAFQQDYAHIPDLIENSKTLNLTLHKYAKAYIDLLLFGERPDRIEELVQKSVFSQPEVESRIATLKRSSARSDAQFKNSIEVCSEKLLLNFHVMNPKPNADQDNGLDDVSREPLSPEHSQAIERPNNQLKKRNRKKI